MSDILNIEDIKVVVNYQYEQLLLDVDTKSKFADLKLEDHLPTIYTFWAFIVLGGDYSYKGNAFEKHVRLDLKEIHFEKWMSFLHQGIYNNFKGENADKMWNQAKLFETMFKAKLIKN
jgi:hypothetical protein